ncbi:MAG: polysaccharide pyruvyl transferase family protein [Eubacteriales bacterium]
MKKIATITTHAALNYGAVLQAYALHRYIEELGYSCDVLNYVPSHVKASYRLVQCPKNLQGLVLSGFQALHYSSRKLRKNRFEAFRNTYLNLSGARIRDHRTLVDTANGYDTIICGSDQIWSPALHDFDEAYFLSFPEVTAHRVSYAASFGQDIVEERFEAELKRRLSGFTDFACREYSGKQLIKKLTGADAEMVLDPVFLLKPETWIRMAKPINAASPYNLVYFLSNPGQSPFAVKKYSEDHGMKTVSIGFSPRDFKYGISCDYSLGPQEFLGAIAGAETIVTNSFHCTAFAILLEKNLYTRLSSGKDSRNDRIVSLLTELGLEDRMYYDRDAEQLDFEKKIDYSAVRVHLQERIAASQSYLRNVLESGE